MKEAWQKAMVYKMVWFKFFLVGLIPFGNTFLAQTETWSGETWKNTGWFLIIRVLIYSTVSAFVAWYAFIDKSLPEADKRFQDTQMWKKDTGP